MSPVIAHLAERFSCACAASDEEVSECFEALRIHVESSLSQTSDLIMTTLSSYPGVQTFLDAHCNYVFQIKKCIHSDPCQFCQEHLH